MTATAPAFQITPTSAANDIAHRARELRLEADRLDLEAAFPRGGAAAADLQWQDMLTQGWVRTSWPQVPSAQSLVAEAVANALSGNSGRAHDLAARAVFATSVDSGVAIGADFARAVAWMSEGDCSAAFGILASQFSHHRHQSSARYLIATTGVFVELAGRTQQLAAARETLAQWRHLFAGIAAPEGYEFELASAILDESDPARAIANLLSDGTARPPLVTARLHLALGMSLRRHRKNRDSRPHLSVAADLLSWADAKPWLAVVAAELRAAGVRQEGEHSLAELSPQEATIATLAAQGLSNRQIGERLYLSPRTVGSHLYRLFPKLGITSRVQLADALHQR